MIKLAIFDLDDTLIDKWNSTFPHSLNACIMSMAALGLGIGSLENAVRRLSEINKKSKNVPEAITSYLNELGAFDQKYLEVGTKAIYTFHGKIKPLPGSIEMLNTLYEKGIGLALVSKGEKEIQMKNLEASGIPINLFKKIIISPDYDKTESYQKVLQELNYSANETLIVGDRYETDLIPGKKLGATSAWVRWGRGSIHPPKEGEVDFIIKDLSELVEIIKKNNSGSIKDYKVCILAGGVGSRMGEFSKTFNKAMIPVQGKPSICHIIEKFSEDVEIVVIVGYKKETIIDYLVHAYPKRKFTFFEVEKHSGFGTGPGYAVLECKHLLQCPFIFVSADTLVKESIHAPSENWFGIAEVDDTSRFCSASIDEKNLVSRIDDKIKCENKYAFIGLAGIKDYKIFLDALENDKTIVKGEIQVSNGFKGLMQKGMKGSIFTWFDTGDSVAYKHALENYPHGQGYRGQ